MKKSIALFSIICLLIVNTSSVFAQTVSNSATVDSNTSLNSEVNSDVNSEETSLKWPDDKPEVNSTAAIVMDASTGAILYSKNIHKKLYPASITKILTALVALDNSSLGETVEFSKNAIYDVDLDSSRIGIDVGEKLTMEQCLYGIMLESANEVSYAIAEHISGSIEAFADLMNKKAKELGCTDSNFVNPHGLPDPNHYTSVHDMALIAKAAINNDIFRQITSTKSYVIPPTNIQDETRYLANHHKFINGAKKFEGAIGGKTGYTSKAKYTLVTFAERNGMTLISVIMQCDSIANEYSDTAKLLNYGFDNFSIYNVADMESSDTTDIAPLFTKYSPLFSDTDPQLKISTKGNVVLPNGAEYKDAKKEIVLSPVKKLKEGINVIGTIKYIYGDTFVGSADILYDNISSDNVLVSSYIPKPTESPKIQDLNPIRQYEESGNLKPLIIIIIVGCLLIGLTLYLILVEIPYRKRRNSYLEKRNRKRSYRNKIDF
ncbi:MAG: Peptidase-S11 domain-containing protein [Lachnoclostridium sp.]|jgi:serine-type D-Ala-D-Ala carboxypeptidase (penicillin-binding protein 5/6)